MKKSNLVKAFAVMAIVAAGAFFAGCADPAGASGSSYSAKYAVGDIILNDGSKVNYETAKTYTESDLAELKAKAIAVIFRADTASKKALGVGLKHDKNGLAWCTTSAKAYDKNITSIQCSASGSAGNLTFTDDTDGSDNLEQIASFLTTARLENDTADASKYPAFYFAKNYKNTAANLTSAYESGWYLPTVAELFDIWKVKATVDAASNLCGGSQFGTSYYWSSSQYASDVITHTGSISTVGTGTLTASRTTTTIPCVQCGLSTRGAKRTGFNYLSILFEPSQSDGSNSKIC